MAWWEILVIFVGLPMLITVLIAGVVLLTNRRPAQTTFPLLVRPEQPDRQENPTTDAVEPPAAGSPPTNE